MRGCLWVSSKFSIRNPISSNKIDVFFNASDDKNKLIETIVLNRLDRSTNLTNAEYCESHWKWNGAYNINKNTFEDRVKSFLDRCGTFLLLGQFSDSDVMTSYKYNLAKYKEISYTIWNDVDDEFDISEKIESLESKIKDDCRIAKNDIENKYKKYKNTDSKKKKKQRKRKIDSTFNKISNLFSKNEAIFSKMYNPTNEDVYIKNLENKLLTEDEYYDLSKVKGIHFEKSYEEIKMAHLEKYKNTTQIDILREKLGLIDEVDFIKWKNKVCKNVFNQNIWDYKDFIIQSNKGLLCMDINEKDKYKSEWCSVDSDGMFEFLKVKYKIDTSLEQYYVKKDNVSKMNKVLMIMDNNSKICYCFDENINVVNFDFQK